MQSFYVGGDPDVLAFDPALRTLYVAGEGGIVSMFSVRGSIVDKIGEGRLGPNAHVVAVDFATHRSYFPLKKVSGRPIVRVIGTEMSGQWLPGHDFQHGWRTVFDGWPLFHSVLIARCRKKDIHIG